MKTILVVASALAVATAPALAKPHKKKPAPAPKQLEKPAMGESFDLLPRRSLVPRDTEPVAPAAKRRTLTEAQVAAVVSKRLGDVEHCWNKLPQAQRIAACTAMLELTIEPNGTVSAIGLGGDVPAGAHRCITQAVARWTFPTAAAQSEIEYGISLRSL